MNGTMRQGRLRYAPRTPAVGDSAAPRRDTLVGTMPPAALVPRLAIVFTSAWLLWLAQMAVAGDWEWWWLHTAQIGTACVVLMLTQVRWLIVVSRVLAVAFAVFLPMLLFAVRAGWADGLGLYAGSRTGLWYGNPNPLVGSMVVSAVVAALAVNRHRWAGALLMTLGSVAAATIQVRGAAIGGILAVGTWLATRFHGRTRWWVAGAIAASAVLAVVALAWFDPPGRQGPLIGRAVLERFDPRALADRTSTGGVFVRLRAQRIGLEFFAERPIAGVGFGGFATAYLEKVDPEATHPITNAHNLLIHLLATGGLLGFLGWALPIGATLWWARRRLVYLAPLLVLMA